MNRQRKVQLLLWAYFWLLIFEGALRKWVLPGLSNPLLVIRDPICIAAIIYGWPYLMHTAAKPWIITIWAISSIGFLTAVFLGHGDLVTAGFGARITILHFPIIFLYGAVFNIKDIWKFARITMVLAVPMTILIAAQFSLPPDHILNIAPGGEGTAGFSGALDKMRPPGIFSFTTGLACFYGLVATFWAGWLLAGYRPLPPYFWASAVAMILALPLSISRTLLFMYLLTALGASVSFLYARKGLISLVIGFFIIATIFAIVSKLELFQESTEVFQARWENAGDFEADGKGVVGILDNRILGPMMESVGMVENAGLLGKGIGLATNVGAVRATGEKDFVIAEGSWAGSIGEMGALLGIPLIFWRIALTLKLGIIAIKQMHQNNSVPIVFSGLAIQGILLGQTSQPTGLGFIIIFAGFMLATCNLKLQPIDYEI